MEIIIVLAVFLVLLFLGVPIAFSLGASTLVWLAMHSDVPIEAASQNMMSYMLSFVLIAMPAFLFVGRMLNTCGVTDKLFRFSIAVVGRYRGGLAHANALASMLFASMSGNAVSDAGGLGLVEMTMMKKAGYDPAFAAGITAASSILGPIIPPSTILVLLGAITNISVAALFYGGIIPGVMMAGALMLEIAFMAKFTKRGKAWPKTQIPFKEAIKTIPGAIPALLTFVIILGSILGGITTPTEAAVMAVWWAIILGIAYRKLTWKTLWATLEDTVRTSGVFLLIISIASFFSWVVTIAGLPQLMQKMLVTLAGDNQTLMIFICAGILLILGCFLDTGSATLLAAPIMLPAVTALGVNPVHFGLVLVIALMIGIITPPFGLCLFVVSDVCDVPVRAVTREAIVYLPAMIVTLIVCIIFPDVVLWLPRLFLGG